MTGIVAVATGIVAVAVDTVDDGGAHAGGGWVKVGRCYLQSNLKVA